MSVFSMLVGRFGSIKREQQKNQPPFYADTEAFSRAKKSKRQKTNKKNEEKQPNPLTVDRQMHFFFTRNVKKLICIFL